MFCRDKSKDGLLPIFDQRNNLSCDPHIGNVHIENVLIQFRRIHEGLQTITFSINLSSVKLVCNTK